MMNTLVKRLFVLSIVVTVLAVVVWQATGGDYYTKYEVVSQLEKAVDPSDPLAAAGFYDGTSVTETVKRNEFRFGLLPTPTGVFDKHVVSVASFVGPLWGLVIAVFIVARRSRRRAGG
jgi:hypothetical protein